MLLGLSVERSIQKSHHDYGSLFGIARKSTPTEGMFNVFEAIGSVAFSFSFVSPLALFTWHSVQKLHHSSSLSGV